MDFNKENCNKLIILLSKDKDNEEYFDMFMNLLKEYLEKYNHLLEINVIPDLFKEDTKIMFELLKITYCDNELINEMANENDLHYNVDEFKEYIDFTNNINYVFENINLFDSDDNILKDKLKSVSLFLAKKQKDIQELNEVMNNLGNTLDKLKDTLEKVNDL